MSVVRAPFERKLVLIMIAAAMMVLPGLAGMLSGSIHEETAPGRDISSIYWPMIGRTATHQNSGEIGARGLLDPVVTWSNSTWSQGAVGADFSGNTIFDGVAPYELFGIVESNTTHVRIRDGTDGKIAWSLDAREIEGRTTNVLGVSPAISNVDSNDGLEIVVVIYYLNQFQVALFEPVITRDASGYHWSASNYFDERKWLSISANKNVVGDEIIPRSSPILHDISGDQVEDVIVGSGNTLYSFYGNNGTLDWFLGIGPLGEDVSTAAVYDNGGAIKRLVVNSLTLTGQNLRTTLVNFNGDHLVNTSMPLDTPLPYQYTGPVPMPVIGPVSGDGQLDIIVSYPSRSGSGRLTLYSYTLGEKETISGILGLLESSPSLSDIDDDGDMELFFHSRYTTTSFIMRMSCYDVAFDGSYSSSVVWNREATLTANARSSVSPLLCDLDEDGVDDAVFRGHGKMTAISHDGSYLWNLSIQDPPQQPGDILLNWQGLIGDLGRDDFTDIYLGGRMVSQQVVDLMVKQPPSENIYLSDPDPVDGRTTRINCLIQNTGTSPARNVVISFLDTPEGSPAELVGYTTLAEVVTTAEASLKWTPDGSGNHVVTVVIDPNSTIIETNEDNNEDSRLFEVSEAFADLVVSDINFLRGDGKMTNGVRLVEGDPSTILVRVENIGEKSMNGARARVWVNGSAPNGGSEFTDIGLVAVGDTVNVSVPWTPPEVSGGREEDTYDIEVYIDSGSMQELDKTNNFGENSTRVKVREPMGGYDIRGIAFDPEGNPEGQVAVEATNNRTGEVLEDSTNALGTYSIYIPPTDYLDGDRVVLYAHKENMWAENDLRVYSEDGRRDVNFNLSDTPTLSLTLEAEGPQEIDVDPGKEYNIRFYARNSGNIPGELTVKEEVSGNSSIGSQDISVLPDTMQLEQGASEQLSLRVMVPDNEPPGRSCTIIVTGTLSANGSSVESTLTYILTLKRSPTLLYEFRGETEHDLNGNDRIGISFPVYLMSTGNVEVSYNLSVSSSLSPYSELNDPEGRLSPGDSTLAEVVVSYTGTEDQLTGDILLRTSGEPDSVSWKIILKIEYPNLEADPVISISDPNMVLGDTVNLISTISNTGRVEAKNIYCAFYADGILIQGSTVEKLGPDQDAVIDTITWNPTVIGDTVITFMIDPDGVLIEEDEEDNSVNRTFQFYPDLSISSVSVEPASGRPGDPLTVTVTLKNTGNAAIKRGYKVEARLGGSEGDVLKTESYDSDVDPEETAQAVMTLDAPDQEGSVNLYFYISPSSEMELAKGNNFYTFSVELMGPEENGSNLLIYLIIGGIAVILLAGAGIYVWKNGLPSGPPPEERQIDLEAAPGEEAPEPPSTSGIEEEEREEGPLVEMTLEPPSPFEEPMEEILVAEVVEEPELPGEEVDMTGVEDAGETVADPDEDDEGLIPEV
ncbi:MAG: CARDB domain-containing protein [Thermoplasmatota archaeon]